MIKKISSKLDIHTLEVVTKSVSSTIVKIVGMLIGLAVSVSLGNLIGAKGILDILPKIKNDNVEIYHYANQGICSWYDFAKAIFKINEIQMSVKPISTDQYPTAAKKPTYSALDNCKIKNDFSISIPKWEQSLRACLKKIELIKTNQLNG